MTLRKLGIPVVLLAVMLIALAYAQTDAPESRSLLQNFKVGDHVTMSWDARTSAMPGIRILTEAEVQKNREDVAQYSEKRREYEEGRGREGLREMFEEGRGREELREMFEEARNDPAKRNELMRRMSAPRRPEPLYKVTTIGSDYLGLQTETTEILVPVTGIRSVRRQLAAP